MATSVDRKQRTLNVDYFECEIPSYIEMKNAFDNLQKRHWKVDYVLSHTCPSFLKETIIQRQDIHMMKKCPVSDFFDSLVLDRRLFFKNWLFGHFHMNKSFYVNDRRFTCLYGCFSELQND